jgi:hypothetical protein
MTKQTKKKKKGKNNCSKKHILHAQSLPMVINLNSSNEMMDGTP